MFSVVIIKITEKEKEKKRNNNANENFHDNSYTTGLGITRHKKK